MSKVKCQKSKIKNLGRRSVILASRSLWRKRLLKKHGIDCRIHASKFKELKKHKNPRTLVLYNACGKAREVAKHYKNAIVIGVDTIGVLGKNIIGKPKNRCDARFILKKLFGRTHCIFSGLCVIDAGSGAMRKAVVMTKLTFKRVSAQDLEKYLATNQWRGKAGAYAIQGYAKKFVEKIEGSESNIVGIPVETLKKILNLKLNH